MNSLTLILYFIHSNIMNLLQFTCCIEKMNLIISKIHETAVELYVACSYLILSVYRIMSIIREHVYNLIITLAAPLGPITIPDGAQIPQIPEAAGILGILGIYMVYKYTKLLFQFKSDKKKEDKVTHINLKAVRANVCRCEQLQRLLPITVIIDTMDTSARHLHTLFFLGLERMYPSGLAVCNIRWRYWTPITYLLPSLRTLGYIMNYVNDWRINDDTPREDANQVVTLSYIYQHLVQRDVNGRVIYNRYGLWVPISDQGYHYMFNNDNYRILCDGSEPQFKLVEDPLLGLVRMIHIPVETDAEVEYYEPQHIH